MRYSLTFILVLFGLMLKAQENPQPDSVLVKIETKDGNTFVGFIIQEDESQIVLSTTSFGDLTIKKALIKTRGHVEEKQVIDGELWFENPHSTRYLWGPSGYGLKTGEAYYQNTWVLLNQVSLGINEYFSVGVGTVPLFLFGGGIESPVWVTPKVSIPIKKDKLNIGAGVMVGRLLGEEDEATAGIFYGVSTFGTRDKNLTIGLGYGFGQYGWADSPTVSISGMVRINKRTYLLSENYFINAGGESLTLLSCGIRSVGKTLALDFALIAPVSYGMDGSFVIPWLGVNIPFGRTRN